MKPFRPILRRDATTEPITDDAALYGSSQVKLAREYLSKLSPERRAQLNSEWEA
jgi:hypothetical protein